MKLHLPKVLFIAVIAAFAASQTVWAGERGDFSEGTDNAYYTSTGDQGDLDMTTTATAVTTQYITPGSGVSESTIGTLKMDHKDIIIVSGTDTDNFSSLTIGSIAVQGTNLNDNATAHAQLQVFGNQHVLLNGSTGALCFNVNSAGSLTLSGTQERLNAYYGQAIIASDSVTITTLDAGMGGSARGGVLVKSGASLAVGTLFNHVNNSTTKAVTLENGATLTLAGVTIKGISSDSAKYATVHRHDGGGQYTTAETKYAISNAQVEFNGTIANKLVNVVLNSDTAGHTLTVYNSANTISKVTASAGTINVQNADSVGTVELTGGELNLTGMTIGSTSSLNLTGGSMSITSSTVDGITLGSGDGTLTISGSSIKGSITSNGNMVLGSGITGESAELSGAGNITIAKTLTGSIKLTGGTIMLDDDFSNYEVKDPGSVAYSLTGAEGSFAESADANGFMQLMDSSYWLVQGDATGTTATSAGFGESQSVTLESDNTGVWFGYAAAVTNKDFYITTGDVTVSSAAQAMAESYVLNGATGRMVLDEGTVSANDIVVNNIGNGIKLGTNATLTDLVAAEDGTLIGAISGTGTIEVTSATGTAGYGTAIAPGADFTGTLYVKSGNFTYNTSNIGKTLKLASGTNFQVTAASTLAADQTIVLESGNHEMHINNVAGNSFTILGAVSGEGWLVRKGSGNKEVYIKGNASVSNFENSVDKLYVQENASVSNLSVSGGTVGINTTGSMTLLHLTGGETSIVGDLTIGESTTGRSSGIYAQHSCTLNIGDGSTSTKVVATRLESGDAQPDTNQTGGVINVAAKAALVITAPSDSLGATGNYQTHGLMLGAWGKAGNSTLQASTLNVSGDFLAQNVQAAVGDSAAIVNIESGGRFAVKGITSCVSDKTDMQLNLKDGGTLVLGASGIHNLKGLTGSFAAGTVGMTADTTIAENIALSSETGTTFNTAKYQWSADGTSITAGTEAGTMTISGVISDHAVTTTTGEGDEAVTETQTYTGKLVKAGAGTLELSGSNTYSGGTDVNGGTLKAGNASALGSGKVTVDGGNLELASNLSVSSLEVKDGTITFGNGTTLSVTESLTLDASAIKLAEGLTFDATDAIELISTNGTLSVSGVDSWTGGSYEIGGVSYVTGLTATDNVLKLTFTQETVPGENSLTTTVSGVEGFFSSEKNMLTLNIAEGDSLADVGSVTISGISDEIMKQILGLEGLPEGGMVGITLLDEAGNEFTGGVTGDLVFQGNTGVYEGEVSVGSATQYNVAYIPEPATATLSLLALAGLAARRRRK